MTFPTIGDQRHAKAVAAVETSFGKWWERRGRRNDIDGALADMMVEIGERLGFESDREDAEKALKNGEQG